MKKELVVVVEEDTESAAGYVADQIVLSLNAAIEMRGRAVLVLAGGNTFAPVYELLGKASYVEAVPWSKVVILFGDERCVAPNDQLSNYRKAKECWLNVFEGKEGAPQVHRMRAEKTPAVAAREYETLLHGLAAPEEGGVPILDVVLLGVGRDGHTASLFPGSLSSLENESALVTLTYPEQEPLVRRVTLTLRAFNSSRQVIFLVTGKEKREIVFKIVHDQKNEYPVSHIKPLYGEKRLVLDSAAFHGS